MENENSRRGKHGGSRPHSGAPTLYAENMKERRIFMPDEMWELCQKVGGGNGSEGTRQIIEEWRKMPA